jgi:hypothetical protein
MLYYEMDSYMEFTKIVDKDRYKKYIIVSSDAAGYIVLERYGTIWNLELMQVTPTGFGIGSIFLKYVLEAEQLNPKLMTVCPTSEDSKRFFQKHGF